ncbi:hypothetical protein [Falsarthrobacter nasiphocae]|uniref:Uncharacterized protein n=1 Tax=Falsarthrobacter nasiphocae TaxID=189863 RepID=A0AAE3YJD0_9MICC|nr:hypothetical protein [Falsarthrobacter nasiphocae]MDR6892786.1 hypothetical protein [Falsarthrobacter nasiphocae]
MAAIVGLFLALVGAAGLTFLKTTEQSTVNVAMPAGSEHSKILRIPAEVGGQDGLDLTIDGQGPWNVSLIRSLDVKAWAGDAQQTVVSRAGGDLSASTEGTAAAAFAPASTDIFATTAVQRGRTVQHIDPVRDNQRYDVVITGSEGAPLPSSLTVSKDVEVAQPWGLPLLIVGLLVALGSLLAWLLMRRKGDDDRLAAGSSPRAREAVRVARGSHRAQAVSPLLAMALAGSFAVPAAVSTSPAPSAASPSASAGAQDYTPTVSGQQLERIVKAVSADAEKADKAQSASALTGRFTGAAKTLRAGTYAMRAKNSSIAPPAPIATKIVTSMVPFSDEFPRSVVAVVQDGPQDLPVALVLEQKRAQDDYVLRDTMSMLPGAKFPKPDNEPGSRAVGLDDGRGVLTPARSLQALADVLDHPEGPSKGAFESTSFQKDLIDFQKSVTKNAGGVNSTIRQAVDWNEARAFPTADGGVMVFGYLNMLYTASPKESGGSVQLSGTPYEKLVGAASVKGPVEVSYGQSVMMYVPKRGSGEKVVVTGVDQDLIGARKG